MNQHQDKYCTCLVCRKYNPDNPIDALKVKVIELTPDPDSEYYKGYYNAVQDVLHLLEGFNKEGKNER